MKKTLFILALIHLILFANAQTEIKISSKNNEIKIIENTYKNLKFSAIIDNFIINTLSADEQNFTSIKTKEFYNSYNIGFPQLPVISKLIEVPISDSIEIKILNYDEYIIKLNDYGYNYKIFPAQASVSKSETKTRKITKAKTIYTDSIFYTNYLISINYIGTMRGINISQLQVNPFSYDIKTNTLKIKTNIIIDIIFHNPQIEKSEQAKLDKFSSAFLIPYNKLWNYKPMNTKHIETSQPIKYVIIADRMFEESLQDFIAWKTAKGYKIIEVYTDVIGNTKAEIKSYLLNLYNLSTPYSPAPSYVLFVGDVTQIPSDQCSGHISDLYYCTFDGANDFIPDMYYGRMSANTVAELLPQIEKTIMYEQYTFPNPSFLSKTVLVAGHDETYSATHSNGQVNYISTYYFNNQHNIENHPYLYPNSSNQANDIINNLSEGASFLNYTAHCGTNGWAGPNFTNTNIPSLTNEGKYFFSIGNCCQSGNFNVAECFGEALLRADKKGAVIHIGGTNNTYWDEDFYWAVGATSTINDNVTYDNTSQGAFDHLFHENGETIYSSAYQMCYSGNMSVTESPTDNASKKYYWEIYNVLGDPSLMPYAGIPTQMQATYPASINLGSTSFEITTENQAYIALSVNNILLDAKTTNEQGYAKLEFNPIVNNDNLKLVITKQFRKPIIENISITPINRQVDLMLANIEIPALIKNSELPQTADITILNLGLTNITNAKITYNINNQNNNETTWSGNLNYLDTAHIRLNNLMLESGTNIISVSIHTEDNQIDEFVENNQLTNACYVYAGKAKLQLSNISSQIICNTLLYTPQVKLINLDNEPLTQAKIKYISGSITDEIIWTGNLAPNSTTNIVFETKEFINGNNLIDYQIVNINNASNYPYNDANISETIKILSVAQSIKIEFFTDRYPNENTWEIINVDDNNSVMYTGGPYTNALYNNITNICLTDACYVFKVYDSYSDGMIGYDNDNNDNGHIYIINLNNNDTIWNFNSGNTAWREQTYNFCITNSTIKTNQTCDKLDIYPNPFDNLLHFANDEDIIKVECYDLLGHQIITKLELGKNITINTSQLKNGIYFFKIHTSTNIYTKKIICSHK